MTLHRITLALAFVLVAGSALSGAAFAEDAAPTHQCFYSNQWRGWKAPKEDVLYIGVRQHDVYRVDLSSGSTLLRWPDAHLVSILHGTNSICSAIDLDLSVSDGHGFSTPLIARSITKLTPEQVAEIPPEFRP